MGAEIVDYLLVFWCALALVVVLVGHLYERQQQELAKRKTKEQRRFSAAQIAHEPHRRQQQQQSRSPGVTNLDDHWPQPQSSSRYHEPNYSNQNYTPSAYDNSNLNHHHQPASYAPSSWAYGLESAPMGAPDSWQLGSSVHGGQECAPPPSVATIPTASGFNPDCVEWVNSILYLFYTQPEKYGPIICENVYRSLNEKLSNLVSSSQEHPQLVIEFEGINAHESSRPELTNIRTESESDKSVSVQCKIYNRRVSLNLSIRKLAAPASAGRGGGGHTPSLLHDVYGDSEAQVQRYQLVLENLEGKLKSMAMLNEKLIVIQFSENPDTKISLRPVDSGRVHTTSAFAMGQQPAGAARELISEDLLVQLILQTLVQVVVDLYFGNDPDFPQYKHTSGHSTYAQYKSKLNNMLRGSAELKRQLKHDLFGSPSPHSDKERRVLVKIVRAKNIDYNQNVTCLMQLDAPHLQQAVSSTKLASSEPYWDEHFLFQVGGDKSAGELTLELWDSINQAALVQHQPKGGLGLDDTPASSPKRNQPKSKCAANSLRWHHKADLVAGARFLGLARVSIEELRRNPVQKVSLPLQPLGPNDRDLSNSVGGELQLELLFMEHASHLAASGPSCQGGTLTATGRDGGQLHKSNSVSSLTLHQPQGEIVSIDRKLTPSGFVITTTTITKQPPQAKQPQEQPKQQDQLSVRNQSPAGSSSMATEQSFDELANFDGASSIRASGAAAGHSPHLERRSEGTGAGSSTGRLSRSRSRSRSFLRAIKKRFSFSRTRSRSVGEPGGRSADGLDDESPSVSGRGGPDYESHSRASSVVSTGIGGGGRAKSVPTSRDPNEVPTIVINRGRPSDTASAFTFAQPKSQLVVEVLEPALRDDGGGNTAKGHYRYYAVPEDAASKRKWRKRGLKLHVFNEHQFVACHLAGSSTCHLCGRVFSRRPGKQGYKCRNCHLLSHKQCHAKVDHNCPYAKRDGLKLEYIDADPPSSLVNELAQHQQLMRPEDEAELAAAPHENYQPQHPRPSRRQKASRMAAKSISIEVDNR